MATATAAGALTLLVFVPFVGLIGIAMPLAVVAVVMVGLYSLEPCAGRIWGGERPGFFGLLQPAGGGPPPFGPLALRAVWYCMEAGMDEATARARVEEVRHRHAAGWGDAPFDNARSYGRAMLWLVPVVAVSAFVLFYAPVAVAAYAVAPAIGGGVFAYLLGRRLPSLLADRAWIEQAIAK